MLFPVAYPFLNLFVCKNERIGVMEYTKEKRSCKNLQDLLAEREGFEPPVPLSTAVFKTAVIDHSTISPEAGPLFACKGTTIFLTCKKKSQNMLKNKENCPDEDGKSANKTFFRTKKHQFPIS